MIEANPQDRNPSNLGIGKKIGEAWELSPVCGVY